MVLNPVAAQTIGDRPVEAIFERPEKMVVPSADDRPWLCRMGKKIDFAEETP